MDLSLDIFFTIVTLGCALPAWVQVIRHQENRRELVMPVSLLSAGVLIAVLFENLITFGPLTLEYSLRFASVGCPMVLLSVVFASKKRIGPAAIWVWVSSGTCLIVWLLLVTMH